MAIKVTSEGGLLYFLQKLRQLFVPRELRTGSSSEYKVLSDNNLTDGLVAKIENADSHVFSGSYSDLTAKPSINGRTLEGSQSLADLGIAAAADVPTRVSQLANDSGFAVATTVGEDIAAGDKATLASAKKYADDKAAAIHVPAKVSELTNDSGYQTSADVQSSVDGAVGAAKSELQSAIESAVSSTYKPAGSVAFASLPAPSKANLGKVYNVTDAFTTTASFVEGAGQTYPKGTNVVCVNTSGTTYMWDVLAGMVDLSPYLKSADLSTVTNADIDAMF